MEISKNFLIVLLLLIVTLIQFNDCYNHVFPPNFDQFSTIPGTVYNFTGSTKYAKIFCIEQLLLTMKKMYDSYGSQRTIAESMMREFHTLKDQIERYTNPSRNGRTFIDFREIIRTVTIMCNRLNDLPTMEDLDSLITEEYDGMIDQIILYDDMASETISEAISDAFRSFPSNERSIFPGTLWCGAGNIASSDHQLGFLKKEDSCCRQHDQCSFNIGANKKFGHLVNNGLFTKSACFCDREFYECLKGANSVIANKIGLVYFTVLSPQCIGYDHPITGCKRNGRENNVYKKCIIPSVDNSKPKQLQWFNNPDYK